MNSLLVNLSFLINKPTGITTYAANLCPHLQSLNPTFLISPLFTFGKTRNFASLQTRNFASLHDSPLPTPHNYYPVPPNLNPEHGTKGHLRRLLWTQLQLPRIYKKLSSRLLFSPVPEAPLFSNCRYIVTVHDLIALRFPKPFSPLTTYQRHYIPQVLAQAEHIICNSTATAQDIIDFCHIPASKITPILLAHDANHFRPSREQGAGSREQVVGAGFTERSGEEQKIGPYLPSGDKNCPYFLYIGRQDPYKNLHRLIAAFAALPNCRDYELWIAGPPDPRYTPLLKADADNLGITERVKFLAYVPHSHLPALLSGALALVFPSLWEGFGLPVLEAMACGTPVITSNLSSLPEVAGDAALLVNPYNTEEITKAMQSIATDSELLKHLSMLGLARANQFSWAKTGQATAETLSRYL